MQIRAFEERDWPQVWPIIAEVVRKADTFCYEPQLTETEAHELWVVPPPAHVVVAVEGEQVLGTANMYANRPGPGSQIASGSLMVAEASRGRGVGRALCEYLLDWARRNEFVGVQFNAVVVTNTPAVALYEKLGFTIIGTVPNGFRHPTLGLVGLHIMYHDLS